jgi:hypothetical protein
MSSINRGAHVIIFEFTRPGSRLEGIEDERERQDTRDLLELLFSCLQDAAVSLSLFEEVQAEQDAPFEFDLAAWQGEGNEQQRIVQRMMDELPAEMTGEEMFHATVRLNAEARIEMKRRRWQEGEVPESYKRRLPFIHAKSCLYALDTLQKALKLLKGKTGAPAEVEQADSAFEAAFPGLVHVRDSAHHAEDRVQGKRRNSRINLQPVMNGSVHAPSGGLLITSMLADNRFGCTLGDGTYGEVEISADSVARAHSIVQSVYEAYEWSGSPMHEPY